MKLVLVLVAGTSIAHADAPRTVRVDPSPRARTEAIVATAVTGVLIGAAALSYARAGQRSEDADRLYFNGAPASEQLATHKDIERWHDATYLFAAASVISVAVTGYLWGRAQPSYQLAPLPDGGAMVGFTSSW